MISTSAFRKKRVAKNIRARQRSSDSDDNSGNNANNTYLNDQQKSDDEDVAELKANIQRFKEKKTKKSTKGFSGISTASSASSKPVITTNKSKTVLSFDDDAEEGEVFQVKKSSQSRRLIKQQKAEKKLKKRSMKNGNFSKETTPQVSDDNESIDEAPGQKSELPKLEQIEKKSNIIEPDLNIKFKDTLSIKKQEKSWTLSGREAEALHMEEDDLDEDDEESNQPSFKGVLETGTIPDAAAIHAARKRRQAARERGEVPDNLDAAKSDFVPLENRGRIRKGGSRLAHDEDEDRDFSDEDRISFTGVKSSAMDRKNRRKDYLETEHSEGDEENDRDPDDWEAMQIRKAMQGASAQILETLPQTSNQENAFQFERQQFQNGENRSQLLSKPTEYNLQGIKARLKGRLEIRIEVSRRHQSDADRAVDELVDSQNEIVRLEAEIPKLSKKHGFYQEIRGYVTDLVECFNEKIVNIIYLEEKYHKSKANIAQKLMDRRREDIRDHMSELLSKSNGNNHLTIQQQQDEAIAEAARQRRAAERDGRRRRRIQNRQKYLETGGNYSNLSTTHHNDGMSSDDELSTLEQANLAKAKRDVEDQARRVLADVVEDFSTISGVKERFENWKQKEPESYCDAYVSLCLPKIFSALVRLQLLFWNPFADHDIEQMEWYRSLSTFSYLASEDMEDLRKDPDRNLISLMVEKVVLTKLSALIKSVYDPLSTSQTRRVTSLIKKMMVKYPTLRGDSKQVRELVNIAKNRIKQCVDQDPYIPIGYSKQMKENPIGLHAIFFHRQFWNCYKLFENVMQWYGIIGDGTLAELGINGLLNKYILIGLGCNPDHLDSISKCSHIVRALPEVWRKERTCQKELSRFAQYLSILGKSGKGLGQERIREIISFLRYIGFSNHADTLQREFETKL